jgi:hypothetical protein
MGKGALMEEQREDILRELARDVGRWAAQLRRRQRGTCVICGKEFEGTTRRIYCSNTCAARAYRQRKRGLKSPRQDEARKGQP